METYGGSIESPLDIRDFEADVIVGDVSDYPEKQDFPPEACTLQVQSAVSCTAHGVTNALEAQYFTLTGEVIEVDREFVEGELMSIDAEDQWNYQCNVYPKTSIPNVGDFTRSACKALVHRSENGGIPAIKKKTGEKIFVKVKSYASIDKTEESFKKYLSQGYAIYTSCNVTRVNNTNNWFIAKRTGELIIEGTYITGHAFCLIPKYDQDGVRGVNSYGQAWGFFKDGTFWISWEQIKNLQTCWILVLDIDKNISKVDKARAISRCKGIWHIAELNKEIGVDWLTERSIEMQELAHQTAERLREEN